MSTNSISQGEQVGILWKYLSQKFGVKIHFAHRTFRWSNEGKGVAAVHCVVIGFGCFELYRKVLFDYASISGDPVRQDAFNITAYLTVGDEILIASRSNPLSPVPQMMKGNQPTDDGNMLLTREERDTLVMEAPSSERYLRVCIGSREFINNEERFCLWLVNALPSELRSIKPILNRIEKVKEFRLKSTKTATRQKASTPALFDEIRQPSTNYLLVPSVSSENREYIPMGFMPPSVISTNLNLIIPDATEYHFGILTSTMHMAWV